MKVCRTCSRSFASEDWICPQCRRPPRSIEGFLSFFDGKAHPGESFRQEYFQQLYQVEKDSFWFQHRNGLILNAIADYFPNACNVLEIGCGTGFVLYEIRNRYPKMTLSGSDIFIEGLRFARSRVKDASFYQMDACEMPFEEEFDLILALDVLEHIENDTLAISQIIGSLKPGGGVIVTVPQHNWLWSIQDEKAFHRRRYTRRELVDKMTRVGGRIAYVTSFVTLLLPVMFLSRVFGRFTMNRQKEYDPLRELKIGSVTNRLMESICMVEDYILKSGISLPAGGSLLCVGIKEK